MNCSDPAVHGQIIRVTAFGYDVRRCGCPVVPLVKSTAPVAAAPNEDRFPR